MDLNNPFHMDGSHVYAEANMQDCSVCIHGFTTELHLRQHLLEHVLNYHSESEVRQSTSGLHIDISNIRLPYGKTLQQSALYANRVHYERKYRKNGRQRRSAAQKRQRQSPPEFSEEPAQSHMYSARVEHTETPAKHFQCAVCKAMFTDRGTCKTHIQTHVTTAPLLPLTKITTSDIVTSHLTTKQYKCSLCAEVFSDSQACRTHVQSHMVKSTSGLTVSSSNHESVPTKGLAVGALPFMYSIERSTAGFTKYFPPAIAPNLVTSGLPFICGVCGKVFDDSQSCQNHAQTHIQKSTKPDAAPSQGTNSLYNFTTQSKCGLCSEVFTNKEDYQTHIKAHFQKSTNKVVSAVLASQPVSGGMPSKQFSCGECKEVFTDSQVCQTHAKKHHMKTDEPGCSSEPSPGNVAPGMKIVKTSTLYCCDVCSAVFGDEHIYKQHIETHNAKSTTSHPQPSFPQKSQIHSLGCTTSVQYPVCSQNLKADPESTSQELYRCSVCGRTFNDKISCEKHMESHTLKTESQNKHSLLRDILMRTSDQVQIATQTPMKLYRCSYCREMFENMAACEQHTATNHLKIICILCEKRCSSKTDLQTHVKIVHPQVTFIAQEGEADQQGAGLGEGRQMGYVKILDSESGGVVPDLNKEDQESGKEFGYSQITAATKKFNVVSRTQKEKACFKCDLCGKYLKSEMALRSHIGSNHKCSECGERFKSLDLVREHQKKSHSCSCDVCGVKFRSFRLVAWHKRRVHKGTEWPPKCKVCGKVFSKESRLERHMMTHTKEYPYVCEICGVGCSVPSRLAFHMKRHRAEKKYKCEVCGKGFNDKDSIKRHRMIHTGEKPYICHKCGRAFRDQSSLSGHLKRLSCFHRADAAALGARPKQVFPCEICLDAFTTRSALTKHLKTCTPSEPEEG